MQGLIHPSQDLRDIAISRIRLYKKNNKKLNKFLLQHLSDKENQYAAVAMSVVTPKGDQDSIKTLLDMLDSKIDLERQRAAFVLGNICENGIDGNVLTRLLNLLDTEDSENIDILREVIGAIGKIAKPGNPVVIEKLIKLSTDYRVRDDVAQALGIVAVKGDVMVIKKLTEISGKSEEACVSLSKVGIPGDSGIISTLLKALDSKSFDEIRIANAIGTMSRGADDDEVVIKQLLEFVSQAPRRLAIRAAATLGLVIDTTNKQQYSSLIRQLFDLCDDEKNQNRPVVLLALGKCSKKGSKKVVAKLLEVLTSDIEKKSHHSLRVAAIDALKIVARKGDRRVIKALIDKLGDIQQVCISASNALLDIVDEKNNELVVVAIVALMTHPDPGVVQQAVWVLGKTGMKSDRKIIDTLMKLFKNAPTEGIKAASAEALGLVSTHEDKDVVDTLLAFVAKGENASLMIRKECIISLGSLVKDRKAKQIEDIMYSILSKEPDLHDACITALVTIGDLSRAIENFKNIPTLRSDLFPIIVNAIRLERLNNPSWQLSSSDIATLEKMNTLESLFILVEHAS